jgi:branched-chain amino acid transport system permease protein
MFSQQLVNALSLGCVYALFALGFTLVFGVLGVVNLSHGAVFMLGAYAALTVVTQLNAPLWVALLTAFLVSGAVGFLIDRWVLRFLRQRDAPHLIPMIATIGLGIFFNSAAQGVFGAENLRFPSHVVHDEQFHFGDVQISVLELSIIALSFTLMLLLLFVMRRTQLGRSLRAIAESPKAAALLGINVEGLFYLTSTVAAALGGVSGVLIALYSNAVFR